MPIPPQCAQSANATQSVNRRLSATSSTGIGAQQVRDGEHAERPHRPNEPLDPVEESDARMRLHASSHAAGASQIKVASPANPPADFVQVVDAERLGQVGVAPPLAAVDVGEGDRRGIQDARGASRTSRIAKVSPAVRSDQTGLRDR